MNKDNNPFKWVYLLLVFLLGPSPVFAEVVIRPPVSLSASERARLKQLIGSDDEAAALAEEVRREADALLNDKPKPLSAITYQGLLDTDARRVLTEESLGDMDKLSVLGYAYAATSDTLYSSKSRDFILAWVRAFKPTGNPINENKLEPVLAGFHMMRDQFSSGERKEVEAWMLRIARLVVEQSAGAKSAARGRPKDNWHAKRLKIVGIIGFILKDERLKEWALENYQNHIADGLYPDGSSVDLKKRDALSYHNSDVSSLLSFAVWATRNSVLVKGANLYDYSAPSGSSLRRSVEFIVPYSNGVKTRREWTNTTNDLDKKRAAAGIASYQPGKLYDPQSSIETLEQASFFDESLVRLVTMLRKSTAAKYSSWTILINKVMKQRDS